MDRVAALIALKTALAREAARRTLAVQRLHRVRSPNVKAAVVAAAVSATPLACAAWHGGDGGAGVDNQIEAAARIAEAHVRRILPGTGLGGRK